jgi:hypothetical protein
MVLGSGTLSKAGQYPAFLVLRELLTISGSQYPGHLVL